jgi:hypothetical protein
MNNYQQTSSVTSMLQTLQWPTLAERRARIKATMMYRIVNGLVAIPPQSYTLGREISYLPMPVVTTTLQKLCTGAGLNV